MSVLCGIVLDDIRQYKRYTIEMRHSIIDDLASIGFPARFLARCRHLYRLGRGRASPGKGAVPGGGKAGGNRSATTLSLPRHRLRQRQPVYQRNIGSVLRRVPLRVHPFRGVSQQLPAWIEQRNGSVARCFVGDDRYSCQVAGKTIAYVYGALHLYVNYLQPSFKLIDKTRDGSTTVKRDSQPATPCDRLIQHCATSSYL